MKELFRRSVRRAKRIFGFQVVAERYYEHAKALSVLFAEMFVMYFMGFAERHQVGIIGFAKPSETLMNEYIVDKEIGESIQQNTEPYKEHEVVIV